MIHSWARAYGIAAEGLITNLYDGSWPTVCCDEAIMSKFAAFLLLASAIVLLPSVAFAQGRLSPPTSSTVTRSFAGVGVRTTTSEGRPASGDFRRQTEKNATYFAGPLQFARSSTVIKGIGTAAPDETKKDWTVGWNGGRNHAYASLQQDARGKREVYVRAFRYAKTGTAIIKSFTRRKVVQPAQ